MVASGAGRRQACFRAKGRSGSLYGLQTCGACRAWHQSTPCKQSQSLEKHYWLLTDNFKYLCVQQGTTSSKDKVAPIMDTANITEQHRLGAESLLCGAARESQRTGACAQTLSKNSEVELHLPIVRHHCYAPLL